MVTEYVMDTIEFLDLSKDTIRFVIEQTPVNYTDMSGKTTYSGIEVQLFLKYTAVSKIEGPKRIIAMKIDLGFANRYDKKFKEQLRQIRTEAPKEILQHYSLEDPGFSLEYRNTSSGHKEYIRDVKEGAFINE